MSQPEVAGEREVGEEVQETRGVQEDDRMMRVEGGERRLERQGGRGLSSGRRRDSAKEKGEEKKG